MTLVKIVVFTGWESKGRLDCTDIEVPIFW